MSILKQFGIKNDLPDFSNHIRVGRWLCAPDLFTFDWVDVLEITKTEEGLNCPIVDSKLNKELRQGVYQLIYKDAVIKNGCFGEGMSKGVKSRFNGYRSMINRLDIARQDVSKRNGSYNTINLLDLKLIPGDTVQVRAVGFPDDTFIDNLPWKVDLYVIEAYLKELHKDTIWLI
jgi:hypothetical protein